MRISLRFALVLAVLLPALCAVTAAGIFGLQSGRAGTHSIYEEHLRGTLKVAALQSALQDTHRASLELLLEDDAVQRQSLSNQLHKQLVPAVQAALGPVAVLSAQDPGELADVQAINANWARFEAVLADKLPTSANPAAQLDLQDRIDAEFNSAIAAAKSITKQEVAEADQGYRQALHNYDFSIGLMLLAGIVGLLSSIATVIWLIRSVLPRTLAYSAFATKVGQGDYTSRLRPDGGDELAKLGQVLNELAEHHQAEDRYDRRKLEFIDALQLTETEQDAHVLLRRHLERAIPENSVAILDGSDSTDGISTMTPTNPSSPLAAELERATSRSCLAVRTARPHATSEDADLLLCPVCSNCPNLTTCVPLIVSGRVIGSVLSNHQRSLTDEDQRAIRDAVTQAAPVIGNLRNLARAKSTAATDGLTGLPNRRAIEDTIQRMVSQSGRTMEPVAALMCDLDHFKEINDQHGHGRGDEVLAATAATLSASIRASDFAGRYGGEEFMVLLPGTDAAGAFIIAEKIRAAIGRARVPAVDQPVTMSIGIAAIPEHAVDAISLQRAADQALYAAKNAGRDRVEIFRGSEASDVPSAPTPTACSEADGALEGPIDDSSRRSVLGKQGGPTFGTS